ncbi:MAG TPA: helicase-related protein [Candidatus Acidoferrales bacterium]|nr:helicase-related protein [Candidatus Acidoferrales bacterium]
MALGWDSLSPYDRLVNTSLIEPRAYQINIIKSIYTGGNTLVVLPTGLGKTLIAVFAMANALHNGKKAVLLAPTKPLSEQHHISLTRLLNIDPGHILLLTGSLGAESRARLEEEAKVIAATPQTFANDLKKGRINLDGIGVVVFDEVHKAVGKYAYTYIADECKLKGVQLIGLTASPGSNRKKIDELIEALGVENIEIRISTDPDVEPYVMEKKVETIYVEPGKTVESIMALLKPVIDEHLAKLYSYGLSPFKKSDGLSKGRILEIGRGIDKLEAKNYKFMALLHYVYLLHLSHAYDLVSTEGLYPFMSYFDALNAKDKKSRALNSILTNGNVVMAIKTAKEALDRFEEHPKMEYIKWFIANEMKGKNVIVFAQYRSTIKKLTDLLKGQDINARSFVGKSQGVTQEAQKSTIDDFRKGKFNVLVSTSIGEEGLDIPSVDAVIFYEPVANEIRSIQRRGRAGRIKFGQVLILVARKTKDEAYLMIARTREKRMRDLVMQIKGGIERGHTARSRQSMLK